MKFKSFSAHILALLGLSEWSKVEDKNSITVEEVAKLKNYGFTENNLIYRKHNEKDIVDLMDEWWYLLKNYAKRDQLSFVWLLWKRGIEIEDITFKNTRIDTDNFYVFDHKKSREKVLANL